MPEPERTAATESAVNLLLPEGLSRADAQALGQRLVDALAADPVTGRGMTRGRAGIALTDESGGAVPEGAPTLNRIIGVLSVPMPPGSSLDAVRTAIRGVPGADGVRVAPEGRVDAQSGEGPE